MPPEKVEIVTDAALTPRAAPLPMLAVPPTRMPVPPAEMVPELLMPPVKVEIVIEALPVSIAATCTGVAADQDAVVARRNAA